MLPGQSRSLAAVVFVVVALLAGRAVRAEEPLGIHDPRQGYDTQPPRDRFTRLRAEFESGAVTLDHSGELPLLKSLLRALDVPVSSQLLVTSATSLQKRLISPRRPRAIYFNEDTYVGFVPGGQIEVVSLDPELGGIFYLFDRFTPGRSPRALRTDTCMTCHAPRYMEDTPGLVIESVVPGLTGGGEKAFRREQSGHGIPLELRFGGWLVTGAPDLPRHWGNLIIEHTAGNERERPVAPGELFDLKRYPLPTSDILPHLVLEHQVGFVNRVVQAAYRARALEHRQGKDADGDGKGGGDATAHELDRLAAGLVRYLLFCDEAPLPSGGIAGDPLYKADFLARRRVDTEGRSLRDLDLQGRLFRYRCSYMIASPTYDGLPPALKSRVERALDRALDPDSTDPGPAALPAEEKRAIRAILAATLPASRP